MGKGLSLHGLMSDAMGGGGSAGLLLSAGVAEAVSSPCWRYLYANVTPPAHDNFVKVRVQTGRLAVVASRSGRRARRRRRRLPEPKWRLGCVEAVEAACNSCVRAKPY